MNEQKNETQIENLENYPITMRAPVPAWVQIYHEEDAIDQSLDVYEGVRELVFDQQYFLTADQCYLYKRICKQPTNMAGIENCSNVLIDFNPGDQALLLHSLVIRRNDLTIDKLLTADIHVLRREYEAERHVLTGNITLSIILDEVAIADEIEITYTIVNHDRIDKEFFNIYAPLEFSVPVHYLYLTVIADGVTPLVSKVYGEPQLDVVNETERQMFKMARKHVLAKKPLNYTPPWYRDYAAIQIAVNKSWGEIASAYACYYEALDVDRGRCKTLFADIEKHKPAQTSIPTIILQYIQQSIRYLANYKATDAIIPSHPNDTLNRGYGDCKDFVYLYMSLLNAFGIKSSPILVNASIGRCLPELLPALGLFNHVICAVHLGDKTYYVDPTLRQMVDSLEHLVATNFSYGLQCNTTDPGLIALTSSSLQDSVTIIETYEPTVSGVKGKFHTEIILRGGPALSLIHQLQIRPEAEFWESIDKYYQKTLNIESATCRVINRDAITQNEIRYSVEYFGEFARLQASKDGYRVDFVLRELTEYFSVNIPDAVDDDFYLGKVIDCHYQVNFVSPKKCLFLCAMGEVTHEALSLRRRCRQIKNRMIIDTVLRKQKDVVSKQEYATFRKQHDLILDHLVINLQVQFKSWFDYVYLALGMLFVFCLFIIFGQNH